jgi:HrpA-like RNA helicase
LRCFTCPPSCAGVHARTNTHARTHSRQRLLAERQALPVWGARAALLSEVRSHPTLIVVGETGSGKTTQIPQFLLEAGLAGRRCVRVQQSGGGGVQW